MVHHVYQCVEQVYIKTIQQVAVWLVCLHVQLVNLFQFAIHVYQVHFSTMEVA